MFDLPSFPAFPVTLHAQPGALSDGVEQLRRIIRQARSTCHMSKRGTCAAEQSKSSTVSCLDFRGGAGIENQIVKLPDVELRPQAALSALAQVQQVELSDLVAECLARPGNIAIRLTLNIRLIDRRMRMEIIDYLLSGPMFGV